MFKLVLILLTVNTCVLALGTLLVATCAKHSNGFDKQAVLNLFSKPDIHRQEVQRDNDSKNPSYILRRASGVYLYNLIITK